LSIKSSNSKLELETRLDEVWNSQLIVAGDFNKLAPTFLTFSSIFVDDNNLKLTDINRLNDMFMYCNDGGAATSWIDDHVVLPSDKLWFAVSEVHIITFSYTPIL